MKSSTNISPTISPDILKNIISSEKIKTFGDQLKDKAKEKVISILKDKAGELKAELEQVIKEEIQVGINHNTELKRLETIKVNGQITQEQYDKAVEAENISYVEKRKSLEEKKEKLKEDINNILLDPYKEIKEEQTKLKKRIKDRKKRTQSEENKSKKDLTKQVLSNAAKTLAPIIALQIANSLVTLISQRKKLEDLVDLVNSYIDTQVIDEQTVIIATNLKNNAIALIDNNIKKLISLQKTLQQISTYLTIFNLIVTILSALPIPTAVPPGIGIPLNLITKITRIIERLSRLIASLNVILQVAISILGNEAQYLNELKNRLKEISLKLDGKTIDTLNEQQLTELINTFSPVGDINQFPPYKGFNFKIKEEQNSAFVVKGNKRRYAVAIDSNYVEVLKSEYSFTLDPNDLIEQLKLVIDQQNLQA